MYSGRNYTILNVFWQSKGHVSAKYRHVKNDVIIISPALRGRTGVKGLNGKLRP